MICFFSGMFTGIVLQIVINLLAPLCVPEPEPKQPERAQPPHDPGRRYSVAEILEQERQKRKADR
jgi:hypothetical protein